MNKACMLTVVTNKSPRMPHRVTIKPNRALDHMWHSPGAFRERLSE